MGGRHRLKGESDSGRGVVIEDSIFFCGILRKHESNRTNSILLIGNEWASTVGTIGKAYRMGRPLRISLPSKQRAPFDVPSLGCSGYERSRFSGFLPKRFAENDLLDESLHAIAIVDRGLRYSIDRGGVRDVDLPSQGEG